MIDWCKGQKRGIRRIDPNPLMSEDYLNKADSALKMSHTVDDGEWTLIGEYYACYNALYSLLLKAGIKSEIHDCTIALMEYFKFSKEEIEFLRRLKKARIDAQYYVERKAQPVSFETVRGFVMTCKEKHETLNFREIQDILW